MTKKSNKILDQFLGEVIMVFITGLDSTIISDDGPMDCPMINQGLCVDYDDTFLLLSDETTNGFTLINLDNIAKIDSIQEEPIVKPDISGMH